MNITMIKGTEVKYKTGAKHYTVKETKVISDINDVLLVVGIPDGRKYPVQVKNIVFVFNGEYIMPDRRNKKMKAHDVVRVIYNQPATIVYFGNGTKEVVKVKHGEVFDYTTGVHLCVMKRLLGEDQYNISKKHLYDAIHVARTEMVSKDVNKVVKKIKIAFGFIKEKSAPLPKFAEGDVVECIKDTFNFKKHDTTIIIQLGIQYEGGVSYMTSRPNEHYKNADVYWGINYKDQNKFKKIAEKAKS